MPCGALNQTLFLTLVLLVLVTLYETAGTHRGERPRADALSLRTLAPPPREKKQLADRLFPPTDRLADT